jgi:hypothetical protein
MWWLCEAPGPWRAGSGQDRLARNTSTDLGGISPARVQRMETPAGDRPCLIRQRTFRSRRQTTDPAAYRNLQAFGTGCIPRPARLRIGSVADPTAPSRKKPDPERRIRRYRMRSRTGWIALTSGDRTSSASSAWYSPRSSTIMRAARENSPPPAGASWMPTSPTSSARMRVAQARWIAAIVHGVTDSPEFIGMSHCRCCRRTGRLASIRLPRRRVAAHP